MAPSYGLFLRLTGEKCWGTLTQVIPSQLMNILARRFAVMAAVVLCSASSRAGLLDKLGTYVTNSAAPAEAGSGVASPALNALSDDQLVGGLKQALSNGLQHA